MSQQLALSLQLRDDATFANFYAGSNQATVKLLKNSIEQLQPTFIYWWGAAGVGCTHLLQSCCHAATQINAPALFLSLRDYQKLNPAVLQGLEDLTLIALDDIEAIAGNAAWEEALFHCYNRITQAEKILLVSANVAPLSLPIRLPDLRSRLAAGITFQIKALSDEEKLEALQLRARHLGLILPNEVGRYLLRHYSRDLSGLFQLLKRLDYASLAAQSRLTIPFIKQFL